MVVSLDLFPTFIELASAPPQQQTLDGFSIADLLRTPPTPSPLRQLPQSPHLYADKSSRGGSSTRNNEYVYYPQFPQQSKGLRSGIYAARSGAHKVHWAIQGTLQCGQYGTPACPPPTPTSPFLFSSSSWYIREREGGGTLCRLFINGNIIKTKSARPL